MFEGGSLALVTVTSNAFSTNNPSASVLRIRTLKFFIPSKSNVTEVISLSSTTVKDSLPISPSPLTRM